MTRHIVCVSCSLAMVACGPARRSTDPGVTRAGASPTVAPAAAPDPLTAELNLSFETGDPDTEWMTMGSESLAADAEVARAGKRSLRITCAAGAQGGAIVRELPIDRVRGKRVRVSGWIRTRDMPMGAGLWIRADGPADNPDLAFANTQDKLVSGTSEWSRRELAIDVPPEARVVFVGGFTAGSGTVWYDDLQLRIEDIPAPTPITVSGTVLDAGGGPVAGATVAAIEGGRSRPARIARTDARGQFSLALWKGRWALTATGARGAAAYWPTRELDAAAEARLYLGTGGFTVTGKVTLDGEATEPIHVLAFRLSDDEGDLFVTAVDADGRYQLTLPTAKAYGLQARTAGAVPGEPTWIKESVDARVDLTATILGPPGKAVVSWIASHAIPLATVEAGHGFDDMRRVDELIGSARIVALGEATHGTREFFQMKHRMLEYLVEKKGFRVFAIEANQPEARRVNAYVVDGVGNPAEALAGLYFWTWNTEEVLALIEWMRAYNADPRHKEKVQFTGFDMQTPTVAWANVTAYLRDVDPAYARGLPPVVAVFGDKEAYKAWPALSAADQQAATKALAGVIARLESRRAAYQKSSHHSWHDIHHDARVVQQAIEMFAAGGIESQASSVARDRAMAENVGWLLDRGGRRSKIVLWAHNGHISRHLESFTNMGSVLSQKYGKSYLPIGFVFSEGSFQARDDRPGGKSELREITLGPPPAEDVSTAFVRAGHPLAILDLRAITDRTAAAWFTAARPMRDTGAVFISEQAMTVMTPLAGRFGAVIFVEKTTRARPLP